MKAGEMPAKLRGMIYVPVRKADGREFLDLANAFQCKASVEASNAQLEKAIPAYCAANPLQRIVKCEVTVIDDADENT